MFATYCERMGIETSTSYCVPMFDHILFVNRMFEWIDIKSIFWQKI